MYFYFMKCMRKGRVVGKEKERYDLDLIFRAANVCSVASFTLDHLLQYQVPPLDPQLVLPLCLSCLVQRAWRRNPTAWG